MKKTLTKNYKNYKNYARTKMYTTNSIIKKITYVAIGLALSFTSIQVSAGQPDNFMPSKLCFHINNDPNHPDPLGSYLVLRTRHIGSVNIQNKNLKLRQVSGISIGRLPVLTTPIQPDWGDWVGNPITGTCHPHSKVFQCSLHSISSITTPFPPNPVVLSSIETARGDTTLVYDKNINSIVLARRGEVDVTYFDLAGNPIPDNSPLLSGPPVLKTFKKIENFFKSPDITEVNCRNVPHPEIPPFTIPMP